MKKVTKKMFTKPCVVGISADVNQGKSMLLYNIINSIKGDEFKLYTYGLRMNVGCARQVYSVAELEQITNSIIIIDELSSLFDLDNRKIKKQVENTLRLINHNNNVLILCGTPENFKKFIGGKLDMLFYKKTTMADLINGSRVKNILSQYKGYEMGSEILNLKINEALFWDGRHYDKVHIDYLKRYDTKADNVEIVKKSEKKCAKSVPNFVQEIKNKRKGAKPFLKVVN